MKPKIKIKIKIWDSERNMWRFIKVTEDPVNITGGGPTDEGFFCWQEQYWQEDGLVFCSYNTVSRDCDGPMETNSTDFAEPPLRRNDYRPAWKRYERSQRDHYAEAMGY